MPLKHRQALALFRCGVAPFRIETGRYGASRLPEHERKCLCCASDMQIENEYHALFVCEMFNEERRPLMELLIQKMANFDDFSQEEKLRSVFANKDKDVVMLLAKTLCVILQKRKSFFTDIV